MTALPPQPATVFVGREGELATLRAALAAASAGNGRVVILAGEPGIGKTRLADELAAHAAAEGATVRWGRCWEGAGAPAFWPWIQILRSQFAETEPAELRAQLGAGAEDVAQLVPELHERLPGIPPPPSLEGAAARFCLFDSVVSFLRACAAGHPLALILEDLHWADAASLGLLRFLADEMKDARLLIVATYRDIEVTAAHPLSEFVGALAYHPLVQRVELHGLSEDEIGRLIEALGHEGSPSVAARIHRQSGGNPFFATELARAPNGAGVPGGVRDVIGNRLRRLSEGCNRLLGIASVIGSEFNLGTLERVAAGTPILPLLSEARDARILVEVPGVTGTYGFAHALIREVLYTRLPLEVRSRLHWHVAAALEALGELGREHDAGVLAHHLLEAITGCVEEATRQACVDKAVLYATKAAEQATAMCGYEEAALHYERALRLLRTWAAHDARQQYELLLAMGEAQTRAGVKYAVRSETFHCAAALARELGEPQLLARAAVGLAARTSHFEAAAQAHVALLREALDAVGTHDSAVRVRLLGSLVLAKYFPDPRMHSAPLSAEALAIARRVGDPRTLGSALLSRYLALTEPEQAEERMALATEVRELGKQLGDIEMVMYGRLYRLYEVLALGQVATVERELAAYAGLADNLRQPFFRSRAVAVRAALALLAGRFADAEQLAREALRLIPHTEDPLVLEGYLRQLGLAYWEQDRLREIEDSVAGVLEHYPYAPAGRALPAWFHAEQGRVEEARAEIEQLSVNDLETLPRFRSWFLIVAMLADTCTALRDTAHAATLYALLLPYARHLVFESSGPTCRGSVSLVLGQLAYTMGRWDDALRHLDEALAAHERLRSRPWIANTECARAAALLARGCPGDWKQAAVLLDQVLRTTEQLGMRRLQRKALALHEQLAEKTSPFTRGALRGVCSDRAPEKSPLARLSQRGEVIAATFRKEGEYWVIGYKSPAFRLKNRVGLRYLGVLVGNPGREFLAIDLIAATQVARPELAPPWGVEPTRGKSSRSVLGGPDPYFDAQTRREYARRLHDLRATIEEAQAFNDSERASRTKAEMDLLTDELGAGIGLRGRIRASGSPVERARVSVTMAVKGAQRAIARNDPALGRYLAASIKTGTFCSYSPDPHQPVAWEL
jgi:tetratricopeptide (TPR) repeat protein